MLRSRLLSRLPLQAALALLMPGLVSAGQAAPPRQPLAAAQPERQALASAPRVPDAAALFDWAPRAYPQFFKGSFVDGTFAGYTYRFFPDTGNYVGVQGSQVAVLGPVSGGAVLNVGQLADFACLVYPADCAVASPPRLSAGNGYSLLRQSDGSLFSLGVSETGFAGRVPADRGVGTEARLLRGLTATAQTAGNYHALAVGTDGRVYGWGLSGNGNLGVMNTNLASPQALPGLEGAQAVAATDTTTVALRQDGSVWYWPGTITYRGATTTVAPRSAAGLSEVRRVHAGLVQGPSTLVGPLAVRQDGTVWQLSWTPSSASDGGVLVQTYHALVKALPGLSQVTDVACSSQHCLALRSDGSVWAWGRNVEGQLGNGSSGSFTLVDSPVAVAGLGDVRAVAAAGTASLALDGQGRLWTWGNGLHGQGNAGVLARPTLLNALTEVVDIAGGENHALVRRADGSVWSWGRNGYRELGDGSSTSTPVPVRATGLLVR